MGAIGEEVVEQTAGVVVPVRDVAPVEVGLFAGMRDGLLDVLEQPDTKLLVRDMEDRLERVAGRRRPR